MKSLDDALYELWDRMKRAVARIQSLSRENDLLREENEELRQSLDEVQSVIASKSRRIEELEMNAGNDNGIDGADRVFYLSNEEREQLEQRIDELLKKIESHLQ